MAENETHPDEIERELEVTRERMDQRLSQLEEKLSPTRLINDGLATVIGGNGSAFSEDLLSRARRNPIPVAVTAIGVGWWLLAESRHEDRKSGKGALPPGMTR